MLNQVGFGVGVDHELVRSWSFTPIASPGFQDAEVRFLQDCGMARKRVTRFWPLMLSRLHLDDQTGLGHDFHPTQLVEQDGG